jgi:hypothetical protein
VQSNRRTRTAWTAAIRRAAAASLLLGLGACSGGGTVSTGYSSAGLPYGGMGDESGTDDGETGIDLDGGGPPPPPGDDGGLPPPPGHGDCCVGHDSPGCDNKPVEQCVCASDSWCCESEWDDACADLIEQLGCGHCTASDGGDPPPPSDDGSEPPPSDDGGEPPPPSDDGGEPPPPSDDGGGEPPPPSDDGGSEPPEEPPAEGGDCCMASQTPGCADAAIEACVCMQDAYCCDTAWDGLCVDQVGTFGCGSCGPEGGDGGEGDGGGAPSACCEQQAGPGCPDATVQECVCAVDDYCCSVFWDLTCVGEVETLSCGSCS